MDAWSEMERHIADEVWDQVHERLRFRPSTEPRHWPGIVEPTPSVTYSIARAFSEAEDRDAVSAKAMELNLAILSALQRCVPPDGTVYVMDWQHPSFVLRPHGEFESHSRSGWRTEPFPDGDYYFFLHPGLRFGTFGHPWEETICLFGQELICQFDETSVSWLGPKVRVNGTAA